MIELKSSIRSRIRGIHKSSGKNSYLQKSLSVFSPTSTSKLPHFCAAYRERGAAGSEDQWDSLSAVMTLLKSGGGRDPLQTCM